MYRTHHLNQLRKSDNAEKVTLSGWVNRSRDHGGIIFIDLRDREGVTQIVFDPEHDKKSHEHAQNLRSEDVIKISGKVRNRPSEMINSKIATGEIEVLVDELEILNKALPTPFEINSDKVMNEELRLKFRYLDLRREKMKQNLIRRHQMIKFIRDYFDNHGFIEVETPIMIKGTPEGSREYIVPARLYPGKFYVLPQSPQQLKQLLMVAGLDKYFQIARCFRDEDQRGDRQPEFTQLDIEMSFVEEEDIMQVNEKCLIEFTKKFLPEKKMLQVPFPRLTWQQAMENYGSDKPDLRFEMKIVDVSEEVQGSEFKVFADAVKKGGVVKALKVEGAATFSRSEIDELEQAAKIQGAKGLAYITFEKEVAKSPILKFFDEKTLASLQKKAAAKAGDVLFFAADKFETACNALGAVRLACAKKLNLIDENLLAYCWVNQFPLFEFSPEENKLVSCHHPFTSPRPEDIARLDTEPEKVKALAYDIVMNGVEIGGGSIRIHNPELQSKIFDLLQISKPDAERRFGHLLKAFTFGAPPHGGIAWGLDRLVMIFQNEPNIREVIAFPKDQKARDLMTGAPSILPEAQITEVHIKTLSEAEEGVFGRLKKLFDEHHIWYEHLKHEAVTTSEEAAKVRGTELKQGAKALLLKTESSYIIAVFPASESLDFEKLKKVAKTNKVELAGEDELEGITECKKGALPPFGNLFNLETFVENSLLKNEEIVFNAGSATDSFKIKAKDYLKVSQAKEAGII